MNYLGKQDQQHPQRGSMNQNALAPPRRVFIAITGQPINSRWRNPVEPGVQGKPLGGSIGEHVKGDGGLLSADGGISHVSQLVQFLVGDVWSSFPHEHL